MIRRQPGEPLDAPALPAMLEARQARCRVGLGAPGPGQLVEQPGVNDRQAGEGQGRRHEPPRREASQRERRDGQRQRHARHGEPDVAEGEVPALEGTRAVAMCRPPFRVRRGYGRTIPSAVHR